MKHTLFVIAITMGTIANTYYDVRTRSGREEIRFYEDCARESEARQRRQWQIEAQLRREAANQEVQESKTKVSSSARESERIRANDTAMCDESKAMQSANVSSKFNQGEESSFHLAKRIEDVQPHRLTTKPIYSLSAEAAKAMLYHASDNARSGSSSRNAKFKGLRLHFGKRKKR